MTDVINENAAGSAKRENPAIIYISHLKNNRFRIKSEYMAKINDFFDDLEKRIPQQTSSEKGIIPLSVTYARENHSEGVRIGFYSKREDNKLTISSLKQIYDLYNREELLKEHEIEYKNLINIQQFEQIDKEFIDKLLKEAPANLDEVINAHAEFSHSLTPVALVERRKGYMNTKIWPAFFVSKEEERLYLSDSLYKTSQDNYAHSTALPIKIKDNQLNIVPLIPSRFWKSN